MNSDPPMFVLEMQGLGGANGRILPVTISRRDNSSYEFDKLAAFGVKKTLAYGAVDALQLWVGNSLSFSVQEGEK